ncbi:Hypothetical predicted protein [Lecanosticta acicola]|uniref:Uncharacterized protein n=1 Tax=Lecanosticta acicola TaxID=111012 RepID=A0AAI8YYQ9_9PEZI|nr:Hypothetical predicted protein [Lecanosticta acicola]
MSPKGAPLVNRSARRCALPTRPTKIHSPKLSAYSRGTVQPYYPTPRQSITSPLFYSTSPGTGKAPDAKGGIGPKRPSHDPKSRTSTMNRELETRLKFERKRLLAERNAKRKATIAKSEEAKEKKTVAGREKRKARVAAAGAVKKPKKVVAPARNLFAVDQGLGREVVRDEEGREVRRSTRVGRQV